MIAALSPTIGTLIAAATAIAAAFLRFGRKNWLADLPFAFLIFALLAWSLLATSTSMILAGPFLLLCGVSGILAGTGRSERYCKIGLFLAAAALLVATGPALLPRRLGLRDGRRTFPLELAMIERPLFCVDPVSLEQRRSGRSSACDPGRRRRLADYLLQRCATGLSAFLRSRCSPILAHG